MKHLKVFENYKEGNQIKILQVYGDGDYAALQFEDVFDGTPVKDIINNIDDYKITDEIKEKYGDEYDWEISISEFGYVDPKFIEFAKNLIDYDTSKYEKFYIESDIIDR